MSISPCRQLDAHIHKTEGVITIGEDVDHSLTRAILTTSTPDTEVLLAVPGLVHVVLVRHLNQVAQSDASFLMRIAIDVESVLFAVIAYETTISGIVKRVANRGVLALLRTCVSAGVVGCAFGHHHVGETVQHTVATSGIVDHLVVIDLDEVTAVHTDLVGGGTHSIVGNWRIGGVGCIHIRAASTPEVLDLRSDGVQEERAPVDDAHGLVERHEGIFFGGIQRVDLGLTDEVDVRVVDDQGVGALQRVERTGGIGVRLREVFVLAAAAVSMAVVAHIDGATLCTSVARGAAAVDATGNVHIGGRIHRFGLGVVAIAIHIDVGIARHGGSAERTALELAPVAACPNVVVQAKVACLVFGLVVFTKARSLVRRIEDGVRANHDIHRAEGLAVVAGGIHLLVHLAGADVDDRAGLIFCLAVARKGQGVVGVTRSAIQVAEDTTTHHVDGVLTGHEHLVGVTIGTAEHVATDVTTLNIHLGVARGLSQLTAAEHVAADVGTGDGNEGCRQSLTWNNGCHLGEGNIIHPSSI